MFWKKVFEKQRTKRCFGKKSTKKRLFCDVSFLKPLKKRVGSMVPFPNNPYRPSEWATNFENIPYRPSEWVSNFENNPYRPSEWASNFKNALTDPPNGHRILKTALADPPNGHLFRKTPLQTARKQVFHGKRRKPFRPFGPTSSPHGMQQKAGCRETHSTAACLYIDDPSAFNPTISHSRSPADGADWRSWDTCAHSS